MSIIESVKNYLGNCPKLLNNVINVNYLGPETVSYTVDNVPVKSLLKRYSDGETLRQFCFTVASREIYDSDIVSNTEVSEFFEEFERWIELQNMEKNLPDLTAMGLKAVAVETLESGCLYDTARTSARFQIKLRLLYKQKY